MGSPYASGGSSGGSVYARTGTSSRSPYAAAAGGSSGGGHTGSFRVIDNLARDVKDAIVGLPPGLYHVGKAAYHDTGAVAHGHTPTHLYNDVLKPVGSSYAQTYVPLIHAHFGAFAHGLGEHPLGPILDVAALFTGGGTAAAKAGATLAERGAIDADSVLARLGDAGVTELRSPAARAGEPGAVARKATSRNPVVRARQQAVDRALKTLPYETPILGELARFGREMKRGPEARSQAFRQLAGPAFDAIGKLSKREREAVAVLARLPLRRSADAWKELLRNNGSDEALATLKLLENEKVAHLYEQPTEKMVAALEEQRKLGQAMVDRLVDLGEMTPARAELARFNHMRVALGGVVYTEKQAKRVRGQLERDLGKIGVEQEKLTTKAGAYTKAKGRSNPSAAVDELASLSARADEIRARLAEIKPSVVGGPSVEDLRAELAAEGRPEPVYLPDKPANPATQGASGRGPYTYGSPVHGSDLLLFRTGQLALGPDVLTPQFLKVVEFSRHRDLHDQLLDAAVRVRGGQDAPAGHVFVSSPVGLDKIPDASTDISKLRAAPDLTTDSAGKALLDHGSRYAVPVKLARQVAAEQRQASNVLTRVVERSTDVWRALVLNTRVGWLTANIVGNQFLYALQFAGADGARAYANMILRAKGPQALRRMLTQKDAHGALPGISKELLDEYFPEQVGGTFVGSQLPNAGNIRKLLEGSRAGRAVETLATKLAKIDRASESGLRAAAVEAALRSSPELRALKRLGENQTKDFNELAKRALDENPLLARQASDRANAALGDFLGLSQFERRVVRAVFPFYAWYKAIFRVTVKLPLDQPVRAVLLAHLGEIANEEEPGFPVPSYLAGSISLGGDRILKTQALNPLMTVPQVAGSVASFVTGGSGKELGREMNPFAQLAGGVLFGDKTLPRSAGQFATGLPLVGVGKSVLFGPHPSKVYRPSTLDDLLAYFGAGTKTVNRVEAAKQAAAGR